MANKEYAKKGLASVCIAVRIQRWRLCYWRRYVHYGNLVGVAHSVCPSMAYEYSSNTGTMYQELQMASAFIQRVQPYKYKTTKQREATLVQLQSFPYSQHRTWHSHDFDFGPKGPPLFHSSLSHSHNTTFGAVKILSFDVSDRHYSGSKCPCVDNICSDKLVRVQLTLVRSDHLMTSRPRLARNFKGVVALPIVF